MRAALLPRTLARPATRRQACHFFMRWNKPNLRNSLHGLLGRDAPASTSWVRNHGLEEVRCAMIQCLVGLGGSEVARMNMRLRYASDIEALWYLRMDLRAMLVPLRGEAVANATLTQLTPLFQGQLPRTLGGASRPANL